jgi:hypothetical protein
VISIPSSQTPSAHCGRFPVVLDEADVVLQGVDPETFQRIQVELLDVQGRGLHDDLVLVVVLEPVGVFPVSPVGGSSRWLHVGHVPGFRAERSQKGRRVERAGPDLEVIGLLEDATLVGPVFVEGKN